MIIENPDFRIYLGIVIIVLKLANSVSVKCCKPFQIFNACKTKPNTTGNPRVNYEMVLVEQGRKLCSAIEYFEGIIHMVEQDNSVKSGKSDMAYDLNNWVDLNRY